MIKKLLLRTFILFALIFSFSFISSCGNKEDLPKSDNKDTVKNNEPKKVEVPVNAHVIFDVTGDRVGTDDAYLSGKKFRQIMNVKKDGVMKQISLYSDGKTFYLISEREGKKVGIKMPIDSSKDFTLKKDESSDFTDFVSRLESFPTVGTTDVLGMKCDLKLTPHKDTIAIYQGFPLKCDFRSKGFYMIATKFEPNVKITEDMFDPPKDVNYIDFSMIKRR